MSVEALEAFLRNALPGLLAGPLRVELLSGGRSNLTYALTDGRGRWVLRRPPLGHVLATAHDMEREHRVLAALAAHRRPRAQAPRVRRPPGDRGAVLRHGLRRRRRAPGATEIWRPSAVPRRPGWPRRSSRCWPACTGSSRPRWGSTTSAVLRAISGGSCAAGTGSSRRRTAATSPTSSVSASGWGSGCGPARQRPLVHGDYRLDNVVVDPGDGRIVGVLDWEMATLGDPLTDLASAVVWWDGIRGSPPGRRGPGRRAGLPGR